MHGIEYQDETRLWAKPHIWSNMPFRIIGHPDLNQQVPKVFAADPKQGPVAVARIRALLESIDEGAADLEPAPVAQQSWTAGVTLNVQRAGGATLSAVPAQVNLYIFEAWTLRFAIARVELPDDAVVGALLLVETQVAAAKGLASRNLSMALLAKVEELVWPI
jgi:hypothetical protein